jgi:oxygen-independent coproporphyrinogen-3 oxidase
VPHLVPRQRQIDAAALPDQVGRFAQAEFAYERLTRAGYQPVGFDHFASPDDALAVAARDGTLRRNFQGFTEDRADVLGGLGVSAISSFPGWLLQNEKNAGRYHLAIANRRFATARGLKRSAEDRVIARAIEHLLCQGSADLTDLPDLPTVRTRLERFAGVGLMCWEDTRLTVLPPGLPYTRVIAAQLDPYRHDGARRFSSAI